MSWLQGGGKQQAPQQQQQAPQQQQQLGMGGSETSMAQQMMAAQEAELTFMTEFYNNIVDVCYKKCIKPKFHDAAMNVGEKSCTERCVSKYIQVHVKVGEMMAQQQSAMQQ